MPRWSRPRHSCLRICHVLLICQVGQWQCGLQCPAHKNLNYTTEMSSVPLVPALFPTFCAELSFLRIPNAKRGKQHQKWSRTKGGKNRSGCLTPAFSRAQTLCPPTFSGIPNAKRAEQNKKWLPHPCLLGGPKKGGNATSPLHSRGSPTRRAGSKMRTRPQQRGTKSKVATSPLPSRRPKTRPKCYLIPAFSGIPNAKRGKQH